MGAEGTALAAAFRGRSVLVTGHTGFKGSWLALWLNRLGARVSGFALDPPTSPSNFALSNVSALLGEDVRADIRDLDALRSTIRRVQPEVIFHLAGQPLVRRAYDDPAETFGVNVMGTVNVLEAVRLEGRPCVVIAVTSDKCYENQDWTWGYRESDRLGGSEPYGASKAAAELAIVAYQRTYFAPGMTSPGILVASVRAGNVIGGGDWSADRIIPDVIRALCSRQPVRVRFPEAVRPWQHVLIPLSGYLCLAVELLAGRQGKADDSGSWNLGPLSSARISVRQVVEDAITYWGSGQWVAVDDDLQRHEARLLHLSIDQAVNELGWTPQWGFDESLRRTIDWYRSWYEHPDQDARQRCMADIAAYEAAAEGVVFLTDEVASLTDAPA